MQARLLKSLFLTADVCAMSDAVSGGGLVGAARGPVARFKRSGRAGNKASALRSSLPPALRVKVFYPLAQRGRFVCRAKRKEKQ